MTGLIKAALRDGPNMFRSVDVARIEREDEEARLRGRIAELIDEIGNRDRLLADHERAHADAFAEGVEAGKKEAHDRSGEQLELLRRSLKDAHSAFKHRIIEIERLAALLARDCLEKVLMHPAERTALMHQILAKQVSLLDRAAIVTIRLSAEDFADASAVAELAQQVGHGTLTIELLESLPSGDCAIALRLGEIEVGLNQQWNSLRNLLDEFATPALS